MLSHSSDCRGRRGVYVLFPPALSQAPLISDIMTCWERCFLYIYPQCISLVQAFPACPCTSLSFQHWQYVLSCPALLVPTGQGVPAITDWRSQACRSNKSAQNDYLHSDHLSVKQFTSFASLTQDVLRFKVALDTRSSNPVGVWSLISANSLSFNTSVESKALEPLLMWFLLLSKCCYSDFMWC